jgi:uncharacterized protein YndB with AHSA1/START domain
MNNQRAFRVLLLTAWMALAQTATAGELFELTVSDAQGVYTVRIDMTIHAAPERVYAVLTDYGQLHRLNPTITESERLPESGTGRVRVRTRIQDCVFVFCVDFVRVEDVREVQAGHLVAEIDPQVSDFDYGKTVWKVEGLGDYSRVTFEARLQPGFALPPLIGSYVMKQKLRTEVLTSFRNLECIAQARAIDLASVIVLKEDADRHVQHCRS